VRNEGEHGEESDLIARLLPVLQRNKVDVFLSGHNHNQQLLLRAGNPRGSSPVRAVRLDNEYLPGAKHVRRITGRFCQTRL
jgi:hypothetical protein